MRPRRVVRYSPLVQQLELLRRRAHQEQGASLIERQDAAVDEDRSRHTGLRVLTRNLVQSERFPLAADPEQPRSATVATGEDQTQKAPMLTATETTRPKGSPTGGIKLLTSTGKVGPS